MRSIKKKVEKKREEKRRKQNENFQTIRMNGIRRKTLIAIVH